MEHQAVAVTASPGRKSPASTQPRLMAQATEGRAQSGVPAGASVPGAGSAGSAPASRTSSTAAWV